MTEPAIMVGCFVFVAIVIVLDIWLIPPGDGEGWL